MFACLILVHSCTQLPVFNNPAGDCASRANNMVVGIRLLSHMPIPRVRCWQHAEVTGVASECGVSEPGAVEDPRRARLHGCAAVQSSSGDE